MYEQAPGYYQTLSTDQEKQLRAVRHLNLTERGNTRREAIKDGKVIQNWHARAIEVTLMIHKRLFTTPLLCRVCDVLSRERRLIDCKSVEKACITEANSTKKGICKVRELKKMEQVAGPAGKNA